MAAEITAILDETSEAMKAALSVMASAKLEVYRLRAEVRSLTEQNEMLKRDLCAALGAEDLQ